MFTGLIRRFSSEDTEHDSHFEEAGLAPAKDGIHGVYMPNNRRASPFRPPPLEPLLLHGFKDSTSIDSRILNLGIAEEIRTMVPERLKITENWTLVYSLDQDGSSLATLFEKCKRFDGERVGFVLAVKDEDDCTFGAYLSEYPRPSSSYFGNGECFLWKVSTLPSLPPPPSADTTNLMRSTTLVASPSSTSIAGGGDTIRFKAFPYSGLNDCYINCEANFLSVGSGGGKYGLWLDDTLDIGHSSTCDTFGNEPLSDVGEKFNVVGVELWVLGLQ